MKVQIGGWDQIKHIYDLLDEEESKKVERKKHEKVGQKVWRKS